MAIVCGFIEYRLQDVGTKSEGQVAILKCDEGKEYILYRPEKLPVEDDFFIPYQGLRVEVEGKAEERTGYFCVTSVCVVEDKGNKNDEQEKQYNHE